MNQYFLRKNMVKKFEYMKEMLIIISDKIQLRYPTGIMSFDVLEII